MLEKQLIIGCVAENSPKYLSQALRLLQSVRWFGGKIANADFIICIVEGIDPIFSDEFNKYSATVRIVERFSDKHPQSNKLRFLQQPDLRNYSNILLLDCDTVIVQDPSLYLQGNGFCAKLADGPTISSYLFEKLFNFFELPMPSESYKCTVRGTPTIPYFNAGVLHFSQLDMSSLVPTWIKQNEKLIEHIDLLGNSANFCEQASLSLALTASGTKFNVFGDEMNFPTHHEHYIASLEKIDPLIIHYHWLVTPSGYIQNSKYLLANKRITGFNDRLRAEREKHFDNKMFWNCRYVENPDLGSGHALGEHPETINATC